MITFSSQRVLSGYKEIALYLGVSTKTIQRHLKSLPVSRFGSTIVILESDLVEWIQKKTKTLAKQSRIRRLLGPQSAK